MAYLGGKTIGNRFGGYMLIFNKDKKFDLAKNNPYIYTKDKPFIKQLFDTASKIDFGKVGRSEMYLYGDESFPRCTSVLQMDGTKAGALMEWAKRETVAKMKDMLSIFTDKPLSVADIEDIATKSLGEADRQRDEAADTGTDTHDNIEHWLNGESYREDYRLSKFIDIWNKENVELVCTELPILFKSGVADNIFGYGGRLDILAYKDGKYIIYDIKTSKSVHQGYALQVAAYRAAVEQMSNHHIEISTAKIIHLPDESKLSATQAKAYAKLGNLVEIKNLGKAFNHYMVLLDQYYMRNEKYF